jgi:Ca2+-binding EF-hand superfamily protein
MKPLSATRFRPHNSSLSVKEFYEIFKMIDEKRGQLSRTDFISQLYIQKNQLEQFCKSLIEIGMNYIRKNVRTHQDCEKAVRLFKIVAESGSIE